MAVLPDRFRIRNISISRKFGLVYLIGIILPLFIAFAFYYAGAVRQIRAEQLSSAEAVLMQMKQGLALQVELARSVSDGMYGDAQIQQILQNDTRTEDLRWDDRRVLDGIMVNYLNAHWEIDSLTVLHDNRALLSGGRLLVQDFSESPVVFGEEPGKISTTLVLKRARGVDDTQMMLLRKLSRPHQANSVYMKIDLNMEYVRRSLRNALIDQLKGEISLMSPDGTIMATNGQVTSVEEERPGTDDAETHEERPGTDDAGIQGERQGLAGTGTHGASNGRRTRLEETFPEGSLLAGWRITAVLSDDELLKNVRALRNSVLFLLAICVVLSSSVLFLLAKSITARLNLLVSGMKQTDERNLAGIDGDQGTDEIGQTILQYNLMVQIIRKLLDDVYQLGLQKNGMQLEKAKTELMVLQSQINPHFLYNVLNTIQSQCLLRDEKQTAEVVLSLAGIFRRLIANEKDLVTVREEIRFIRDYLLIQQYRFEDRFSFDIWVDQACEPILIPKMILQVLVENASIHGIEPCRGKGEIRVHASQEDDVLVLRVSDNGAGMLPEQLEVVRGILRHDAGSTDHYGMQNIVRRLELQYGTDAVMDIQSAAGDGTTVTIRIRMTKEA